MNCEHQPIIIIREITFAAQHPNSGEVSSPFRHLHSLIPSRFVPVARFRFLRIPAQYVCVALVWVPGAVVPVPV